jgi:hypothetical protein
MLTRYRLGRLTGRKLRSLDLLGRWEAPPSVIVVLDWLADGADEAFPLKMQNDLLGGFLRG